MDEWGTRSRRDVIRTAAAMGATGVLAGLAGCQQVRDAVGLGSNRTKKVPEDAENAVYVDVQAAMNDEAVKALTNVYLDRLSESEYYEGPTDFEEAKGRFEEQAELDPSKAKWTVGFSAYASQGGLGSYGGSIFRGDWDEDEVVEAYENNYEEISYDEEDHEGKTLYEPSEEYAPYVGVLSGNTYVTGGQDAVEDAIDVKAAGGDKMDQELRKAYGNTRNAPVRYVSEMVPVTAETTHIDGEELDLTPLDEVEHVAGAVYVDGDERGIENSLTASDADAAKDVADVLEGYFSLIAGVENAPDPVVTVAEDVTVERNGTDVVASYAAPVDELEEMLEGLLSAETTGSASRETMPRAGVSVEHEDGSIQATWTSNRNADALYVTFEDLDDGDRSERRLTDVADSTTYTCTAGHAVMVRVLAENEHDSVVIYQRTMEC